MDYLPYSQEYMLAVSIMAGVLLGFIWDIYRLFRHYVKLGTVGTVIGDIVYWIISIKISVQLIFDISYGNVRFFILIGFVTGALLYFYGISKYILKLFVFIVNTVLKFVNKIIGLLIAPVKFVVKKILALLRKLMRPLKIKLEIAKNRAKKRYKFFKFKLKKVSKNRKLVYNKKKQLKRLNKRRKEQKANERKSENHRHTEKSKKRRKASSSHQEEKRKV